MAKSLFAILLLVIISSVCIDAEEYKRREWSKNATEVFLKYEKMESKDYKDFYQLTFRCKKDDTLEVEITKERSHKEWNSTFRPTPILGTVMVEYQFNQNLVLKEEWSYKKATWNSSNIWSFVSPKPEDFAYELLQVMEGEKTQFRFRAPYKLLTDMEGNWLIQETGLDTLHFDLRGGNVVVRAELRKCKALK